MADAIDSSSAERTAVIFYGATLLVTSVLLTLLVRYARSRPDLIEEEGRDEIWRWRRRRARTSPSTSFVLALAFLAPQVAAFGFLAIAVVALARNRGGSRPDGARP